MTNKFAPGDIVDVSIYPTGPANVEAVGTIRGRVFNAGAEYDVRVEENEREDAVDLLESCEPGLSWGEELARDYWLLRNCQPEQLTLVERGERPKYTVAVGDWDDREFLALSVYTQAVEPGPGVYTLGENSSSPMRFRVAADGVITRERSVCQRCGSPLDEEYCTDETCPHSDHKQNETWTEG